MELRKLGGALRRSWWLPVVGLLLGAGLALGSSLVRTPMYTAETQLFVSTTDSSTTADVFQGSQFSQQRVTSYAHLIAGQELGSRVAARLNLDVSGAAVAAQVSAVAVADTVLIDVSVENPSAHEAYLIAQAIGVEFPLMVKDLEGPDEQGGSPVTVTVTERPSVPNKPSSPKPVRDAALGGIIGLLVASLVAVLRDQLDRSVKDAEEAGGLASAPVIGMIFRDDSLQKRHVVSPNSSDRVAEDYRQLRTNLQFLEVDSPPKVIMVSSALPAEGKTTLVVNLGLALADVGKRVVVVEADLRKPKVTRYLGMVSGVGLTNILSGSAEIGDVLQSYGQGHLRVLAAGPTPPNPGQLLASGQMLSLLESLRKDCDYVLVDAPPLLPVADATGLSTCVDGVVLSVRYGETRKDQFQQSATLLHRVGAKVLGVVLNIVPPRAEIAAAYGYRYGYGYEESGHTAGRSD